VDGESLVDLIKKTRVPPVLASRILADTLAGLHAAHELRGSDGVPLEVVHRDLSPSNILISYEGAIKVVDFGVAKARDNLSSTDVGTVKGKFAYMAPEQVKDQNVDRRADVFAVGILLYEATTRRNLFRGSSTGATVTNIISGKFPHPSKLMPNYPAKLERIVLKALEQQPEKRFQTAQEMQLALEEFIFSAGAPVGSARVAEMMLKVFAGRMREKIKVMRTEPPPVSPEPAPPAPPSPPPLPQMSTPQKEPPKPTSAPPVPEKAAAAGSAEKASIRPARIPRPPTLPVGKPPAEPPTKADEGDASPAFLERVDQSLDTPLEILQQQGQETPGSRPRTTPDLLAGTVPDEAPAVRREPEDEVIDLSELLDKSESRRKMLLIGGGCLVLLAEAVGGVLLHRRFATPPPPARAAPDQTGTGSVIPAADAGRPTSLPPSEPDAAPPGQPPDAAPRALPDSVSVPDQKQPPDQKARPDRKAVPAKTTQPPQRPPQRPPKRPPVKPRPKKKLFKIPY
jgi:hypothetical protein